jgi:hypothetical protein
MVRNIVDEIIELLLVRQFLVQNQVSGFQENGFFGDLFDRVAAIAQDTFFTVEIGYCALCRRGVFKARIIALDIPEFICRLCSIRKGNAKDMLLQ